MIVSYAVRDFICRGLLLDCLIKRLATRAPVNRFLDTTYGRSTDE